MKKYIIKWVLVVLLAMLSANMILSQTSPFSRYGVGEMYNAGFGRNFAMGGTGIGVRSPYYLNNTNPASYTAMDTLSFFFEAGLKGKFQQLKLNNNSKNKHNIDIDYYAFAFPITRFLFTSVGLRLFSNTDYHFIGKRENTSVEYVGKGNISNLYGSLGIKLSKSISLGANVNYIFGDTKNFYNEGFSIEDNYFGSKTELRINDVNFDFGAQYIFDFYKNKFIIGGTFSPQKNIRGKSSWITGPGSGLDNDGFINIINSTDYGETDWNKKNIQIPWGFGVGASAILNKRVTIAADFIMKNWKDFKLFDIEPKYNLENFTTANTNYYSAGMEWVPNEETGVKYFERVRYRLGVHYGNDYLKYKDKQIKDYGISFGFGFPLRRTSTSINFTIDLGTKGIDDKTVSRENYGKAILSFTMHEYWFMKNKIR